MGEHKKILLWVSAMKISKALFLLALFEAAQWAAATSPNHDAVTKLHLAQDVQLYAQAMPAPVLDPSESLPPSGAPEAEFVEATRQGSDLVPAQKADVQLVPPGCVSCGHHVHPNTHMADQSGQSSGQDEDEGDGDVDSQSRRSPIPTSTAVQAAGTNTRPQTIPSSPSTTETGSGSSKQGQYSLIFVSCFCFAVLFALITYQITRYRDSKEIHDDLTMALKDIEKASPSSDVVFPLPRSCTSKAPRARSASAPPACGAPSSPTGLHRHCEECGKQISAEDDAYLAFDSYFCSTQCRGDAVATNLGGKLPRSATKKTLTDYIDVCREEW